MIEKMLLLNISEKNGLFVRAFFIFKAGSNIITIKIVNKLKCINKLIYVNRQVYE